MITKLYEYASFSSSSVAPPKPDELQGADSELFSVIVALVIIMNLLQWNQEGQGGIPVQGAWGRGETH